MFKSTIESIGLHMNFTDSMMDLQKRCINLLLNIWEDTPTPLLRLQLGFMFIPNG
jgi:hypothetical protein